MFGEIFVWVPRGIVREIPGGTLGGTFKRIFGKIKGEITEGIVWGNPRRIHSGFHGQSLKKVHRKNPGHFLGGIPGAIFTTNPCESLAEIIYVELFERLIDRSFS